jgi:hypothetical protein
MTCDSIKSDYHHFSPFEFNRTLTFRSPKWNHGADVQLANIIKVLDKCHFVEKVYFFHNKLRQNLAQVTCLKQSLSYNLSKSLNNC